MNPSQNREKNWVLFLAAALLLGILLRLSFPGDIEYKADERYMFNASQTVGVSQPWPLLGMPSGAGFNNPGMSVWMFVALARLTHATNPIELSRAVQLMNILALFVLAHFALKVIPSSENMAWRWATALAAVNPLAVLYERKIWAQDTLPLLCILFWLSWHYRRQWFGAFFWGLLGACLGQIHMSGFFMAASVFIWMMLYDRRAQWNAWLIGSTLGAIPLIPWVQYMLVQQNSSVGQSSWLSLFHFRYWRFWVTDSLGTGLNYSLSSQHFNDFLSYPLLNDHPTYLIGLAHGIVILIGLRFLYTNFKKWRFWQSFTDGTETTMAIYSILILSGISMTLTREVVRHYLIMTFPLEWVWLARLGMADKQKGELCLKTLWAAQLLVSVGFLWYIHVNHGDPLGDYGITYDAQLH